MSIPASAIPISSVVSSDVQIPKCTVQIGDEDVRLKVSIPLTNKMTNEVIFVCDTSGSMDGIPRQQVLTAVQQLEKSGLKFSIINYSHRTCNLYPPNLYEKLRDSWYGHKTYFRKAFYEIKHSVFISSLGSGSGPIDFVFLTDGYALDYPLSPKYFSHDNGGDGINLMELEQYLKTSTVPVTIHTFGLGREHDREILEEIRKIGKIPGTYNYASVTSSGDEIAEEIHTSLKFASCARDLEIDINGVKHKITLLLEDGYLTGDLWLNSLPNKVKIDVNNSQYVLVPVREDLDTDYRLAHISEQIFSCRTAEDCIILQKKLDTMKQVRVSRSERQNYVDSLTFLQRELDKIRATFVYTSYADQGDIAARMHALAFRGKLSKARRQRTMEQRQLENGELLQKIEEKLKNMHKDLLNSPDVEVTDYDYLEDDIGSLSLSDIMKDAPDDLLVIGTQALRNEVAIDQPVCMTVKLTTTCLSFSTFETGALFRLQQLGRTGTGNFDYSKDEVMKGTSGESINSCLPVYGSPAHYKRVVQMLPIICGLFFTLSESGYHPKQIPALYAILYRLHKSCTSDRHRAMVAGYLRFCARLYMDNNTMDELEVPKKYRPHTIMERFYQDVSSHQKSELPTLDIIHGFSLVRLYSELYNPYHSSILLSEVIRRRFCEWSQKNDKSIGYFYHDAIKMVTPTIGNAEVEVMTEPCMIDGAPSLDVSSHRHFQAATFEPYKPLAKHRKDISFGFISSKLKDYSDIPDLRMSEEEFRRTYYVGVLQGCLAWHNDKFRILVEKGYVVLDPLNEEQVEKLHSKVWSTHNKDRELKWKNAVQMQSDTETATFLIHTVENINDFVQVMKSLEISRGQNIWNELVEQMFSDYWLGDCKSQVLECVRRQYIPLYEDKLAIMLSGEYKDDTVINGIWMAGKEYGSLCRERLQNTHSDLLEKLDEQIVMHQYRSSGKLNRNGYGKNKPFWNTEPTDKSRKGVVYGKQLWQTCVDALVNKWDG